MAETGYVELIGEDAIPRGERLLEIADEMTAKIIKLNSLAKESELFAGQAKNLTDLNAALNTATVSTNQMTEAAVTGSKAAMAARREYVNFWKQALNEQDRAIADNARAFTQYEKDKATAAKQSAKEQADAQKVADQQKAQADKEYQQQWVILLKERDQLQRDAAAKAQTTPYSGGTAADQPNYAATGSVVNAGETAGLQEQQAAQAELAVTAKQTTITLADEIPVISELGTTIAGLKIGIAQLNAELKEQDVLLKAGTITEEQYLVTTGGIIEMQAILKTQLALTNEALIKQVGATDANIIALREEALVTQTTAEALAEKAAKALTLDAIGGKLITTFIRMGIHFLAFTLIIKGIEYVIEKFTGASDAAEHATKSNEDYAKSLNDLETAAVGAAEKDIARVNVLTKIAADANESYASRGRAIDELQKKYPDYFGNLSREAILQGNVKDQVNGVTQALLDRAAATAAEDKFAEAGKKRYELTLQLKTAQESLNNAQSAYNGLTASEQENSNPDQGPEAGRFGGAFGAAGTIKNAYIDARDKVRDLKKEIEDTDKQQRQFLTDAQASAAAAGSILFNAPPPIKSKSPNGGINADAAANQRLIDANAETERIILQQNIDSDKLILDNANKTVDERIHAAGRIETAQEAIAANAANTEIEKATQRIADINKLKDADKSGDKNRMASYLTDIETQNTLIRNAQQKLYSDNATSADTYAKNVKKVYEEDLKVRLQGLADVTAAAKAAGEQRIADLRAQLTAGLITEKEYLKQEKIINAQNAIDIIDAQKKYLVNQLFNSKLSADEQTAIQAKLHLILADGYAADAKAFDDAQKKKRDAAQETAKLEKELADAAIELFKSVYDAQFDSQKTALDEKGTAAQAAHDDAVNLINEEQISQLEKDALIKGADADLANQQKKIHDEQIKLAQRKAAFDRKIAEGKILENTAIAITKAAADFGFPLDLPIIILQAALGAAQIALIESQPLPSYYTGIDSVPRDQYAWTDERGPEIYVNPDGSVSMGSNQPNIKLLRKGTRIINAEDTAVALAARPPRITGAVQEYELRQLAAVYEQGSNRIVRAIENQPRPGRAQALPEGYAAHLRYIDSNFGAHRNKK